MKKTVLFILTVLIGSAVSTFSYSEETVAQLKEKIIDIQNAGELGFRNFTLCTNIIGYGQYVAAPDNKVKAGSEIYFYYEPVNLFTNRLNQSYQIWYTQDMIILSQDGKELYRASDALNFNYQSLAPVMDIYASNTLNLKEVPPGIYQFQAVIHDKLKKRDATYSFVFEVVP
ncbi:MAG: hypothetical protein JW774_04855 [Candidatus Aureabacteria bacterium]|nr:hypothetical protein [Candidatus Auribacterota bacterium]